MMPIIAFLFWPLNMELFTLLYYRPTYHVTYTLSVYAHGFSYWHICLLFLVNPVIVLHYPIFLGSIRAFTLSCGLLVYIFLCYLIALIVAFYVAGIAYGNLRRYNRGSLFRQSFHVLRCYCRDLWHGHESPPCLLRHYISFCFIWTAIYGVMSKSFLCHCIGILVYRLYLEDLHYGRYCRAASLFNVFLFGFAVSLPLTILCPMAVYEAWHPTLGDDGVHPGYAGLDKRLAHPLSIAPDDLCLYHCLVAAADLPRYYAATEKQRSMWAKRLRCKTIALLDANGLSSQARRLELSGSDGYPDEEDFRWLSMASGVSFEIVQTGMAEPLCYGRSAIGATVQYVKVADGAGHLSDHYQLVQVYYDSRDPGRRLRLRRKTRPLAAMFVAPAAAEAMTDDVKIGQLSQHHSTIAAAISHYPFKRATVSYTHLTLPTICSV